MMMLKLEDLEGSVDAVLFPEALLRNQGKIHDGAVVFVRGRLNHRRDTPSITVEDVIPVHRVREDLTRCVTIRVNPEEGGPEILENLREVVMSHPGRTELYLEMPGEDGKNVLIQADRALAVTVSESLIAGVCKLLGEGHLVFHPAPAETNGGGGNGNRTRKGYRG